jgi:uncharacterized membrane protein YdjX (TVP38/TMEM64 family)
MGKNKKVSFISYVLQVVLIALLGAAGIVFSVLYIDTFNSGFWYNYSTLIVAVAVSLITIITAFTIAFIKLSNGFIYKLFFLSIILILLTTVFLYVFKITGVLDKIDSVKEFREYISSFGNYAVILFIVIQFLQVVILPLPSFITVGAGVLLFGPFRGAIFSFIGIFTGSTLAYFIGKIFGVKVVKWLVGEDNLKKGLKSIQGRDKIILTFMFLFPFFPDDLLCFVAGITMMSPSFFIVMILLTRLITIFVSSYSMNNSIIPYNTWWGILIWILFFIFTAFIMWFVYKKGDIIERKFINRKHKKKTNKNA